jgi:hypothetical protein
MSLWTTAARYIGLRKIWGLPDWPAHDMEPLLPMQYIHNE